MNKILRPKIELICQYCKNQFYVYPSRANKAKYCSYICAAKGRPKRYKKNALRPYRNGRMEWAYRLIAEKVLGRLLKKGEHVHHINTDRTDNRNSNLLICSHAYHRLIHCRMKRLKQI